MSKNTIKMTNLQCYLFSTTLITILCNLIEPGHGIYINLIPPVSGFGLSRDSNDIHFYLYPSSSTQDIKEEITGLDESSIHKSSFKIGAKTVILVHGFWANSSDPFPVKVKNAYLDSPTAETNNYIVVEWGRLGYLPSTEVGPTYPLIYAEVVLASVPIVAKRLADFIWWLERYGYTTLDSIHLVGHSLGAHISGLAGNQIQNWSGGRKVNRITGLDPAGPLFDGVGLQRKLRRSDADFVDIYHTAMGTRGDSTVDGHADFFVNGGHVQPDCLNDFDLSDPLNLGTCSHMFVVDIFAASIRKNITACKCESHLLNELLPFNKLCLGNCGITTLAGEPCLSSTRGQYYFSTSNVP